MKNYLLSTFVCILIMLHNMIHAQEAHTACKFSYGVYSELTVMPVKAASMASGVIDGKIYLAGGFDFAQNGEFILPDHLSVYDPGTDTWDTTGARIPVPRFMIGAGNIALDGKLYLIGGSDWVPSGDNYQYIAYARVDVYDTQSDTWESKANLPVPLGANGVCSMDGIIYVTGGGTDESNILNSLYSYDPETDNWKELTEMPGPRAYHYSVALDGKIYVIGGNDSDNDGSIASCEVYDPDSDQWTPISPLPKDIMDPSACVVDGEIYVFGGSKYIGGGIYEILGVAYKYNPEIDTWFKIDSFDPDRTNLSVAPIGRTVYMIGGRTWGDTVSNLVQTFELSDVKLDSLIPDITIDDSVIEVDLSAYFSHVDGGDIQYTVCHDDTNVIATEINGNTLTITGLSSGKAVVSILAESEEDQMGDVFRVTVASPSGIDERGEFTASLTIYPNPARGMTTLEYSVQSPGIVRLEVYDLTGKRVAVLLNEYRVPGEYEYLLNTGGLEPGIYFCDLTSASGRATVKLIVGH